MTIDLIHVIAAVPASVAISAVISAVIMTGEYLLGR